MAIASIIQHKRDSAADWTTNNPTLEAGRIGWESDTNKFKFGDGATAWNSLPYAGGAGGGEAWDASFDGSGSVVVSGANVRKPVMSTGTIAKAAIVADTSGSVTVDVVKYTPSGGALGSPTTLGSIALSSATHNSSTPSWAVTAGDVLGFTLSGTIASVKKVFVRLST